MEKIICQSCGMPLNDENKGTKFDQSLQNEYCIFCYANGDFVDPSLTFEKQTEKLIEMAVSQMNMEQEEAREQANMILPKLKRWKK